MWPHYLEGHSNYDVTEWQTYHIWVYRAEDPEQYEVYGIALCDPLPPVAIPLRPDDSDIVLELQPVIDRCYKAGGYLWPAHRLLRWQADAAGWGRRHGMAGGIIAPVCEVLSIVFFHVGRSMFYAGGINRLHALRDAVVISSIDEEHLATSPPWRGEAWSGDLLGQAGLIYLLIALGAAPQNTENGLTDGCIVGKMPSW